MTQLENTRLFELANNRNILMIGIIEIFIIRKKSSNTATL